MEIKEYADRIREEIKKADNEADRLRAMNIPSRVGAYHDKIERLNYLRGKKEGLNEAFNIFTDLVKGDL